MVESKFKAVLGIFGITGTILPMFSLSSNDYLRLVQPAGIFLLHEMISFVLST